MEERPNVSTLNADNDSMQLNASSCDGEYDVGNPNIPNEFEATSNNVVAETSQGLLVEGDVDQSHSDIDGDNGEIEFSEIQDPFDEKTTRHSLSAIGGNGEIEDPLCEGAIGQSNSGIDGDYYEHVEFLDIQPDEKPFKEEPVDLAMMHISLDDSNNSDDSVCFISAKYLDDPVVDTDAK